MLKNHVSLVLSVTTLFLLVLPFQNCGEGFAVKETSSSSSRQVAGSVEIQKLDGQSFYLLTKKHIMNTLALNFQIYVTALDYDEESLSLHQSNELASIASLSDVSGFFSMSEKLVAANLAKFLACPVESLNDSCLLLSIKTTGRKLFRRDLTADEVSRLAAIAKSLGPDQLQMGTQYAVVAMLNSPNFLYQKFYGQDGRLTDQELASRIAFFLLEANPDEALLNAAASGKLSTQTGIASEVDRILSDKSVMAHLFSNFLQESWKLTLLDETPTAEYYADQLEQLKGHITKEFALSAENIYKTKDGDFRRVFDSDTTFVNKTLAEFYDLPTTPNDATWKEVSLPANRRGLFSTGLVMAAHSGNKYTSTIHRGLFVVNELLCQTVPDLPSNIQQLIAASGIDLSDNDTVAQRTHKMATTQPCMSCHTRFDPYGMVFEHFDNFGKYFSTRYGAPVETMTMIKSQSVEDMPGLSNVLLLDESSLVQCFLKHLRSFASGGVLSNQVNLAAYYNLSGSRQFQFNELVRAIILDKSFSQIDSN